MPILSRTATWSSVFRTRIVDKFSGIQSSEVHSLHGQSRSQEMKSCRLTLLPHAKLCAKPQVSSPRLATHRIASRNVTSTALPRIHGLSSSTQSIRSQLPRVSILCISESSKRWISTIPKEQGATKVQFVRFMAGKKKFNNFLVYSTIFFVGIRALQWYLRDSEPSSDVEEPARPKDATTTKEAEASVGKFIGPEKETKSQELLIEINDEDAWFIPCTWPKKKPLTRYLATEDDWKFLVQWSRDNGAHTKMRKDFCDILQFTCESQPTISNIMGSFKYMRHWLEIDMIPAYSEGYEINGFLLTDELLAWATRDYDDQVVENFKRLISPVKIFNALWDTTRTTFFGHETIAMKDLGTVVSSNMKLNVPGLIDFSSAPQMRRQVTQNVRDFRHGRTLSDHRRAGAPKGCVVVSGNVEAVGSKARIAFEVCAHYHPKEKRWESVAIDAVKIRPMGR